MDRSLFLARLIGPTFVAIAVGMLINLNMYESMIAETLRPSILLNLSGAYQCPLWLKSGHGDNSASCFVLPPIAHIR